MSTKVNIGWLKDSNNEKFAPKTFTSQIISENGKILEDRLQNLEKNEQLPVATNEEVLSMLMELDMVTPTADSNGKILTANNGSIYIL